MAAFTSVAAGADLQQVALYTEIEDSLFHRFTVTGATGAPTFAVDGGFTIAGDDITEAVFWFDRQTAMETLVINAFAAGVGFISDNSSFNSPATTRLDYAGDVFADVNFIETAADLWALVNNNSAGPRRVPGGAYPADVNDFADPAYSFGKTVIGDQFGPWLHRDLQQALNFMRFTAAEITNATFQENNKVTERDPTNNSDFIPSDRRVVKGGAFDPPKSRSIWGRRYVAASPYTGNWTEIFNSHDTDTFETNPFEPMGSEDENPRIVQGLLSSEMGTDQPERMAKRIYSERFWSKSNDDNVCVISYTEKGTSESATDGTITHKADVYSIIGNNLGDGLPLDLHQGHDQNLLPLILGVGLNNKNDPITFDGHEFGAVAINKYVRINNDTTFQAADPRTVTHDPPRPHVRDTPIHSTARGPGITEAAKIVPFHGYILGVDVLWAVDWNWPFSG